MMVGVMVRVRVRVIVMVRGSEIRVSGWGYG